MENQQPRRFRLPSRRVTLLLLALLVVLSALAAGAIFLLHKDASIANEGNSILYVTSSVGPDGYSTQLTMLRTSDGAVLWQYKLSGLLSPGRFSNLDEALQAHQAIQIVYGMVYFVVDPGPGTQSDPLQSLMALRASDGKVLWQQQVRAAVTEMLGVGNGVVFLLTIVDGPPSFAPKLYGFQADTGDQLWQRFWTDIVSNQTTYYTPQLVDGHLYAVKTVLSDDGQALPNIYAIDASSGRTLWEYPQVNQPNQPHYERLWPIFGANGIIAFYGISSAVPVYIPSAARLVGLREIDGTTVWHDNLDWNAANLPYLEAETSGFFASNGVLYFANRYVLNDGSGNEGLQLNAVRLQDGHQLWQKTVTDAQSDLVDMTLASGHVYILSAHYQLEGNHPAYTQFSIDAFATSDGAHSWSDQSSQMQYIRVQGSSTLALFSTGTQLSGVRPGDGSTLWQLTLPTVSTLTVAGNTGITSSLTGIGLKIPTPASASICALDLGSGATRWCKQFKTEQLEVLVGP